MGSKRCAPTLARITDTSTKINHGNVFERNAQVGAGQSLTIGAYFCWASHAGNPRDEQRNTGRDVGMKYGKWADAAIDIIVVVASRR